MRKTYLLFLILCSFIFSNKSNSQQWIKYFGGNLEDKAYAITIDNAGYIYIAGYTTTTYRGTDFRTIKINPNTGSATWIKDYNGPANQDDKIYAITTDRLNNIYVVGITTGIGVGTDMTVVKYNSSGTQLWAQSYNSTTNGNDGALGVAVDDSLNVYVTGYVTLAGLDMYLVKYNSSGVYQWGQSYGGSSYQDDKAYAITVDKLDNIYIGGYTINNAHNADFTLLKYNRNGTRLWVGKYDGPAHNDDIALCMALSEGNKIYLAGSSKRGGANYSEEYLLVRFNTSNGDTVWSRRYSGTGDGEDKIYAITIDELDNIYVTGSVTEIVLNNVSHPILNKNYMTIKYNAEGNVLWSTSYDTNARNETARALFLSQSKDFLFVTGSTRKGSNLDSQDVATVKYDVLTGEQLQASIVRGAGNGEDDAYGIYADSSDNIYLAGYMKNAAPNGFDMIAAKYNAGDLIEVKNISSKVPGSFNLYQNYPNPFNPTTSIKFDVPYSGNIKMIIYDILGRQIETLVNETLRSGTYEVSFSSLNLASGVYFYELTSDSYRDVKKMILIK